MEREVWSVERGKRPGPAGPQAAGQHTLRWNDRSLAGSLAPAGVYLIRLTARADDGISALAVTVVTLRR